jgi:CheY-like chemotaxis protein
MRVKRAPVMLQHIPETCTMASILVVEDDPALRDTLVWVLNLSGYAAVPATDGRQALDYLRAGLRPSLILLDLHMPGMDGWAFRAEQRRDPALAPIPVIVVSAEPATFRSSTLGAVDYIEKPTGLGAPLLEAIARHTQAS